MALSRPSLKRPLMSRRRPIAAAAALALTAVAALPLTGASAAETTQGHTVVLAKSQQGAIHRPTLDAIKRDAGARGVTLEQAIDSYLAQARTRLTLADEPDGPVEVPEVSIDDLTAAQLVDLRLIAMAEGISLEQAIENDGWQDRFIDIADELQLRYPDEFSGAARTGDGAWFAFKGNVPATAIRLAKTLPVRVSLEGARGFSEAELQRATDAITDQVSARPEVGGVAVSYDIQSAKIMVNAELQPAVQGGVDAMRQFTPTTALKGITVEVAVTRQAASLEDEYIRGGGTLGTCTSGYNLRYTKSPYYKRHGTAGHCAASSSTRTYKNHSGDGGSTTVSRVWSHQGTSGDIGYYTTGSKTPTRTFYYDWNKKRYATSQPGRPSNGTKICHFGKTTGASCSTVKDNYVNCDPSDAPKVYGLVQMKHYISAGGDSGGPWYYGGAAYGIHYGKCGGTSAFTPTFKFTSARDYKVWYKAS